MNATFRRLAAVTMLVGSGACAQTEPVAPSAHLVERARVAMGSSLTLTAWTSEEPAALSAFDAVFAEFDRLEDLMSVWKDGSDIVRLNAAAGERPVPISAEVRDVILVAHQVSEWTGGKFDVTFGALSGLWKFDTQDQDDSIPDRKDVQQRLSLIDFRDLEIDERAGTAFLKRKGMRANLGGIGKGYAIDRAVQILHRRGIGDFMIQAGGDLFVAGRKGGQPWRLGIRDPRGPADKIFASLDLSDATFSTSGDYERFFMKNGRRYHHIIDPVTGEPAQGCRSVTIVTNRAVLADGLSTGVFLLGPVEGMALIERLPDLEGVIVSDRNEVLVSSGLKNRLMLLTPPTDAP